MEYLCHKWPRICSTCRSFPHSWLITGFVTRLTRPVPLVEQELQTFFRSTWVHPVFLWGSCYSFFSCMCMFCRSLFVRLSFYLLAVMLSVLLRFTDSDYPFGIFKLSFFLFFSSQPCNSSSILIQIHHESYMKSPILIQAHHEVYERGPRGLRENWFRHKTRPTLEVIYWFRLTRRPT